MTAVRITAHSIEPFDNNVNGGDDSLPGTLPTTTLHLSPTATILTQEQEQKKV